MTGRTPGGDLITLPQPQPSVGRGFADPVHDAHATFRAVLTALSEPGRLRVVPAPVEPPAGMSPAMAAIALALVDFETPVWMDAGAVADAYVRFHTGAPIVRDPSAAAFAFVTKPRLAPPPAAFASGSLEYPDRSTTIVVDVEAIATDSGWTITGPGIPSQRRLSVEPLGEAMLTSIAANRAGFPCGHDFIFCRETTVVALPRSSLIDRKAS